jgi:hypothetical protein
MNKLTKQIAPFTQVPNELLQDRRLSMKAKGLYAMMFSKPEGWTFYESALVAESADGKDAVNTALRELIAAGWLTRSGHRAEGGRFTAYNYEILVAPHQDEKSAAAKPRRENRDGKPATSNTDPSNTEEVTPLEPQPTKASRRGPTPEIRLDQFIANSGGVPPSDWGDWAHGEFGWTAERISFEWADFTDYWTSGNAKGGGRKADWPATWRSHCRRFASDSRRGGKAGNGSGGSLASAVHGAVARLRGDAQAEAAEPVRLHRGCEAAVESGVLERKALLMEWADQK